jgi:hypothetical protein
LESISTQRGIKRVDIPLKLLFFVACEKVIVGEDDHLTSMIGALERVTVQVLADIPTDAAMPFRWNAVAMWRRERDFTTPQTYQQRIDILRPDGEQAGGGEVSFAVSNAHSNFRNVMNVPGIPVGVPGICRIKLSIREKEDDEWIESGDYPIEIVHDTSSKKVQDETST